MSRFGLCGIMMAHPGQRDALLDELLQAADLVVDLPGCEVWIVSTMPDNPDAIWVSEADHAASLANDAVKGVIARARPLIAEFGERFTLEPVARKRLAEATP